VRALSSLRVSADAASMSRMIRRRVALLASLGAFATVEAGWASGQLARSAWLLTVAITAYLCAEMVKPRSKKKLKVFHRGPL